MVPTTPLLILASIVTTIPADREADQARLKPFASLVGEWKGTGQPKRGSARGSWTESGTWVWKLTKESAALAYESPKGKYLRSATLKPGEGEGTFTLEATLADGTARTFTGKVGDRKSLALAPTMPVESGLAQITLTPLHDTRFLMLLEAKEDGALTRLGEVGYTKQGVAFAAGDSAPPCVVTEGRGTIPVTFKGKTYYVCCSGCKDLFNDDPEGVLAEAAERRAKAK